MTKEVVSTLKIELVDKVTAQATAATAAVEKLGAAFKHLHGMQANMGRLSGGGAGGGGVAANVREQATAFQQLGAAAAGARSHVQGLVTGLAGGVGLLAAHDNLMQFSLAMREIARANPNWTPAQLKALSEMIQTLRSNSPFSSRVFAEGANTLARAGIDDIKALAAALPILNTAAQATSLNFEQLSEYLVVMSSRFGLSTNGVDNLSSSFQYLAGLMTRVSEIAPGKVFDFVNAMKLVGSAVPSLKVDIQDLTGLYVMLDKAGIQNEEAGATLRAMIKGLIHPTRAGRIRMAELGISAGDYSTSREGSGAALARGLGANFGGTRDFSHMAPFFDEVFQKGLGDAETSDALYEIAQKMFGGKLRPQDSAKLKKAIDSYLSSNVETLDLQKAIEMFNARGVSFGQLIDLVEARQAGRAMLTIRQPEGPKLPGQDYVTPRSMMLNPDTGKPYSPAELYARTQQAADKQFDDYAKAFEKLQSSFDLLLRSFGESWVFRRMTAVIEGLGTAINDLNRGTGDQLESWVRLGLAAAGILAVFGRLGATLRVLGAIGVWVFGALTTATIGFGGALAGMARLLAGGLVAMAAFVGWQGLAAGAAAAAISAALYGAIKLWENRNAIWEVFKSWFKQVIDWIPTVAEEIWKKLKDALHFLAPGQILPPSQDYGPQVDPFTFDPTGYHRGRYGPPQRGGGGGQNINYEPGVPENEDQSLGPRLDNRSLPASIRTNNPGAIMPSGGVFGGERQVDRQGKLGVYATKLSGARALVGLIRRYQQKYGRDTIFKIIEKWAPASDGNDPVAYSQEVAKELGVGMNDPIDTSDPRVMRALANAIARIESGKRNHGYQGSIDTAVRQLLQGGGGGSGSSPSPGAGPTPMAPGGRTQTVPGAPPASGGNASGGTLTMNNHFHINGSGDPQQVAQQVAAILEQRTSQAMRGIMADAAYTV